MQTKIYALFSSTFAVPEFLLCNGSPKKAP